jgi:hypothetical protein
MVPMLNPQYPALYNNIREAIAKCHSVDECKDIVSKAEAMALYYKQANDQDTLQKFFEIKLRAWRRLGELMLSDAEVAATAGPRRSFKLAMERMGTPELRATLREYDAVHAMKLARIDAVEFEAFLGEAGGSMAKLIELTDPRAKFYTAHAEAGRNDTPAVHLRTSNFIERLYRKDDEARTVKERATVDAAEEADEVEHNVGLTLLRKYRRPMRVFGFYLSFEAHEQLRRAAFERRVTMHHVLRAALDTWFVAKGLPAVAALPELSEAEIEVVAAAAQSGADLLEPKAAPQPDAAV